MNNKNELDAFLNEMILGFDEALDLEKAYQRLVRFADVNRQSIGDLEALHECLSEDMPKDVEMVLNSTFHVYLYAMNIIKGRNAEVEKILVTSPHYACLYAQNMIGGRWLEAESAIASNSEADANYKKLIMGWYKNEEQK